MADDLIFNKQKLGQFSSSKKTTTVEAAFDSDESDWSDNEEENASAVKPVIAEDTNSSLKSTSRNIPNVEGVRKSPPIFSSTEKNGQDSLLSVGSQRKRDPVDLASAVSYSPSKRRNSVQKSEKEAEQHQLSSSPYFVKENPSLIGMKSLENKINTDASTDIKEEKLKVEFKEDDDDWDEESYNVTNRANPKLGETSVKSNNKIAFFQPSSSHFKHHGSGQASSERYKVDWSETFSEGGSESGNADNDNIIENLPEDENQTTPLTPKFTDLVHEEVKKQVEKKSDVNEVRYENHNRESKSTSPPTKKIPEEATHGFRVEVITPSPATTISVTKGDLSSENLDSINPTGANDFGKESSEKTLPSSSSAAQLFMATPSSPYGQMTMDNSKSTLNLTTSNPYLVDASKPKKKSKPSSAKHMLTRLFSTDGEKNSKEKNTVTELPPRKSSEPIPLSTLLLNTPITITSAESESRVSSSERNRPHVTSGTIPLIPTRYFPPDASARQGYAMQVGEGDGSNAASGPKKRKGFIGKMKKTFGISSKGSKMRTSESLKNLPAVATAAVVSDPCMSSETNANSGERVIAVHTKGRPPNEVIADLLKEGKKYLESENYSPNGSGDGNALRKRYEQRKYAMSMDQLKSYSSVDDLLTPSVGSSKMAKSEISLVGDHQSEVESVSNQGMPRGSKMSSYYCSQTVENSPNRKVIYNLIDDFCCVVDKSFGEQDRLKHDNGNLFSEIDHLRGALECCETGKTELERQFQDMQGEFQKLQFSLEEECEARSNLEGIVGELKAQMERQDEILNSEVAEKAELLTTLKQVETDNWNLKNQISDFTAKREEFTNSFKGFESTRNKCTELQNALVDCCEKHDLMEKEILNLRGENNEIRLKLDHVVFEKNQEINNILKTEVLDLRSEYNETKMKLDNCEFEKNKLVNDMESIRQTFAAEKAELETKISELQEGISTLEKSKGEICKQTNTMLAAHHEEMDNLKAEAENYKVKYEQEHKIREDLEHRLRITNSGETGVFRSAAAEIERSSPGSFPLNTRTHNSSYQQRLTSQSEPSSLSQSSIGGKRDTFKK